MTYMADPGEANSVTIKEISTPSALEITDTGAIVSVGSGCTSLTPNRARCSWGTVFHAEVDLGDGDDFLLLDVECCAQSSLRGGEGNDTLVGGKWDDILLGDLGDDTLRGRSGSDSLDGGPGADLLKGGTSIRFCHADLCRPDEDTVTYATRVNGVTADADGVADDGEPGESDTIFTNVEEIVGGSGNDRLIARFNCWRLAGLAGNDVLVGRRPGVGLDGGAGSDLLLGTRGWDFLSGGAGNDRVRGGFRADVLSGDGGDDVLRGGRGADSLYGGAGDDMIVGGWGRDRLRGNADRDLILARDGHPDIVQGGADRDRARIDLALDTLRDVERILP